MDDPGKRSLDSDYTRPAKKRGVSRPASPSGSPSQDQDESMTAFQEPLNIFRKDAISRQWKEYMRSCQRLRTRVQDTEQRKSDTSNQLQSLESQFEQLQMDLQRLLNDYTLERANAQENHYDIEAILTEDWIDSRTSLMNKALKQSKKSMHGHNKELTSTVSSWTNKRKHLLEHLKVQPEGDRMDKYQRALSMWLQDRELLTESGHQYRMYYLKYLLLGEELQLYNSRLRVSQQIIHRTQLDLAMAESQLATKDQANREEKQPATDPVLPVSSTAITTHPLPSNSEDPLLRAQRTLAIQWREIEDIKDDRINLKQQLVQLELDLIQIPEAILYKSSVCHRSFPLREFQMDRAQHLGNQVDKLQQEMEDMVRNRRRDIMEMEHEQDRMTSTLRAELSDLEKDLTSIRGQRDDLQCKIELIKATTQDNRCSSREWQHLTETRSQCTAHLETQVLRSLQKAAACTGSSDFYQFVMSLTKPDLILDDLRKENLSLEEQMRECRQNVQSTHSLTPDQVAFLQEEAALHSTLAQLNTRHAQFIDLYGFDPINDVPELTALQSRLTKEQQDMQAARQRIESLEKTEVQLLNEIDNVAKAYGDYEEQNMALINTLAQKEDDLIQLQHDKVKFSHTFTALNKSKDAYAMVANALTKQIERQMAYIKELNEKEKSENHQAGLYERQIASAQTACKTYQQKIAELKELLDQHKDKTRLAKERVGDLEKSLLEMVRVLEQESLARLQQEEEMMCLRHKIERDTKVDTPTEIRLRKEKEEYRSLLNCSSCGTRLKSHVLMRCMHTFCKDCLDIRIETRQRRCPTCNENFGMSDMRQFYL